MGKCPGSVETLLATMLACLGLSLCQPTLFSGNSSSCGLQGNLACQAKLVQDLRSRLAVPLNSSDFSSNVSAAVDQLYVCLGEQPTTLRPLNVLINAAYGPTGQNVEDLVTQEYGWSFQSTVFSSLRLAQEVQNTIGRNVSLYDLVIFSNKYLQDFARYRTFFDLTTFTQSKSSTINWGDVTLYYRDASTYNGQIIGLPLVGQTYSLYYRRDILAAHGYTQAPATWDEVVTLAEQLNGTDFNGDGVGDWAMCNSLGIFCQAPHVLMDIAANVMQTKGRTQGFLFDPDTLEPLINNKGWVYSMDVYRRLARLNPLYTLTWRDSDPSCSGGVTSFLNGTCLFNIQSSVVFKGAREPYSNLKGKVGAAVVPGVTRVWDRDQNVMRECDANLCPFAERRTLLNGSTVLVNFAPWKGTVGYSGGIPLNLDPQYQQAAFEFLSTAMSLNISWQAVLDPTSGWSPLRESMIEGPAAVTPWLNAGYDPADVGEWLASTKKTLSTQNAVLASGLPQPDTYQAIIEAAAANITYSRPDSSNASTPGWDVSIPYVLGIMSSQILDLMASTGPPDVLLGYYRASLGLPPLSAAKLADEGGSGNGKLSTSGLVAAIVVSVCVGGGGLVLVGALLVQLQRARTRSLTGKVKPPGIGAETTLVLTDVEGSTTLFEDLPQNVMDLSMKLHHDIIRKVALEHSGYEWATEGDSFLLAFHCPRDAVLFGISIQEALLVAPWPEDLLGHELARAVWVQPATRGPSSAAVTEGGPKKLRRSLTAPRSSQRVMESLSPGGGDVDRASTAGRPTPLFPQPSGSLLAALSAVPLSSHALGPGQQSQGGPRSSAPGSLARISQYILNSLPGGGRTSAPGGRTSQSGAGGAPGYSPPPSLLNLHSGHVNIGVPADRGSSQPSVLAGKVPAPGSLVLAPPAVATEAVGLPPRYPLQAVTAGDLPTAPHQPSVSSQGSGLHHSPPSAAASAAQARQGTTVQLAPQHASSSAGQLRPSPAVSALLEALSATGNGTQRTQLTGQKGGLAAQGQGSSEAGPCIVLTLAPEPSDASTGQAASTIAPGILGHVKESAAADESWPGALPVTTAAQQALKGARLHHPALTVAAHLSRMAEPAAGPGPGCVLVFNGLRVRVGMHSGVPRPSNITFNRLSGRMQYSGVGLEMARAVQGVACGGQVLLSESSCRLLPVEALRTHLVIAHEGQHVVAGTPPEIFLDVTLTRGQSSQDTATDTTHSSSLGIVYDGDHEEPALNLYSAIGHGLMHRVPLMAGRIRSLECVLPGFLSAPFGHAAVCFMNVAGVATLREWDSDVTVESLTLYRSIAVRSLCALGGYLLEFSEHGLLLVAFPLPAPAIRWALSVVADCLEANWPPLLLEHEMGEEVAVRSMAQTPYQHSITSAAEGMQRHSSITVIADGRGSVPQDTPPTLAVKAGDKATEAPGAPGAPSDPQAAAAAARTQSAFPVLGPGMMHHPGISQRQLLFRGLRLRCGIDYGIVSADLHATTGRITYRGRVMNRASRIAGVTKTGQVWCSEDAWLHAEPYINSHEAGYGVLEAAAQEAQRFTTSQLSFKPGLLRSVTSRRKQSAAVSAAQQAGRTGQPVSGTLMGAVKLKGISEEVPVVALALGNDGGVEVLAVKNTVAGITGASGNERCFSTTALLKPGSLERRGLADGGGVNGGHSAPQALGLLASLADLPAAIE